MFKLRSLAVVFIACGVAFAGVAFAEETKVVDEQKVVATETTADVAKDTKTDVVKKHKKVHKNKKAAKKAEKVDDAKVGEKLAEEASK